VRTGVRKGERSEKEGNKVKEKGEIGDKVREKGERKREKVK
jgi:hypothetical protein